MITVVALLPMVYRVPVEFGEFFAKLFDLGARDPSHERFG
jgi:hypothetical protein